MSEKALTASRSCLQWKDVAKLAAFRLAVNPPSCHLGTWMCGYK